MEVEEEVVEAEEEGEEVVEEEEERVVEISGRRKASSSSSRVPAPSRKVEKVGRKVGEDEEEEVEAHKQARMCRLSKPTRNGTKNKVPLTSGLAIAKAIYQLP